MNSVIIKPPYDENCCHARTERSQSHAIEHVKKIVRALKLMEETFLFFINRKCFETVFNLNSIF